MGFVYRISKRINRNDRQTTGLYAAHHIRIGRASFTAVNNCFPKTPPSAAPNASGVPVLKSTVLSCANNPLPTEYKLIESTVQPDKKLIVDTLVIWNKSRVGLMITPPPIPQIAPAVDARKLTPNAKIDTL